MPKSLPRMMARPLPTYLRTYRRRHALSQRELAELLGYEGGRTAVARVEAGERPPTLRCLVACEILFSVPAHKLFPGTFREVEALVERRARALAKRLAASADSLATRRKYALVVRVAEKQERGRSR